MFVLLYSSIIIHFGAGVLSQLMFWLEYIKGSWSVFTTYLHVQFYISDISLGLPLKELVPPKAHNKVNEEHVTKHLVQLISSKIINNIIFCALNVLLENTHFQSRYSFAFLLDQHEFLHHFLTLYLFFPVRFDFFSYTFWLHFHFLVHTSVLYCSFFLFSFGVQFCFSDPAQDRTKYALQT